MVSFFASLFFCWVSFALVLTGVNHVKMTNVNDNSNNRVC